MVHTETHKLGEQACVAWRPVHDARRSDLLEMT